jgi:CheY-like chemotaxis protein
MDMQSISIESKLNAIVHTIYQNPMSWTDWHVLQIEMSEMSTEEMGDCMIWTKSIIDSYLKDIEGRVYVRDGKDIHILCKHVSQDILHETGQQICDLIYAEIACFSQFCIYDLGSEASAYAKTVLETETVSERENTVTLMGYDDNKSIDNFDDQIKVLLVEDDAVTRWMVRNALKHQCRFSSAPTASKAYSMVQSENPDIVFLDINLPDQSGLQVLEWILSKNPNTSVVMFSGDGNLDNISNCLQVGAQGFISKPFLKENLLHYISNYRLGQA